MPANIRARFKLPDGGEMSLHRDDSWSFSGDVPEMIQKVLADVQPWAFVDPNLGDYGPYYRDVIGMTGAELVFVAEDSTAPPEAVF